MIYTRNARTDDEAWMLGKLSRENAEHDSFRPEDFIVALDDETDERVAFGRLQYHRNISDDTEYVELNDVIVLDRATKEQGCLLLVKLAEKALENDTEQIFTFPYKNHSVFESVGFENVSEQNMPEVMKERLNKKEELHGSSVQAFSGRPKNITFEIEEKDKFEKPEGTTEDEIKTIKEELGVDENASTKYSI